MAARLTLIKKIVHEDIVNVNQLIINTLFGDFIPEPYDPNKIYNKGDIITEINENGSYRLLVANKDEITGPFNIDEWSEISFSNLLKDSSILTQHTASIKTVQEGIADDLSSVIYNLAGLLDAPMDFNQIYRENFKLNSNVKLNYGIYEPGYITSNNGILDYQLANYKEIAFTPTKFKLKHHIEITGDVTMNCTITFNALDDEPFWFDASDAMLDGSFFEIPEFEKQEEIPYAMNIKIKCNCDSNSSIKISDLMVVFI